MNFNPRPPRGGRHALRLGGYAAARFQSTPPARGATLSRSCLTANGMNFNPRPPRGGRPLPPRRACFIFAEFQSTPPARGATLDFSTSTVCRLNFNPRPPRGGRHNRVVSKAEQENFNPRPPRGGRLRCRKEITPKSKFQSTPPARGATCNFFITVATVGLISIHAPREGGDVFCRNISFLVGISIHAPREGGDGRSPLALLPARSFQSTPPARGATLGCDYSTENPFCISIHAPREGGDCSTMFPKLDEATFQSTPPARGATLSDSATYKIGGNFNPRPPRGGRQGQLENARQSLSISIHAPREGGDGVFCRNISFLVGISIHAPREGGDQESVQKAVYEELFQSTPPARGATAKMHSFTCGSLTNK